MKNIKIYTGVVLSGLLIWMIFWVPGLIVCSLATVTKPSYDECVFVQMYGKTADFQHVTFVSRVESGWNGLLMACWAPSLFLLLAGSFVSYYVGQRQMKEKMEKDFPYAADLSFKSAVMAREKEDLEEAKIKFNDDRIKLNNERSIFEYGKEVLEDQLRYFKEKSEDLEKRLENERLDYNNRKVKMNNLETRIKKLEIEKMGVEKDNLALERKYLDIYAKNIELERKLKQLEQEKKVEGRKKTG